MELKYYGPEQSDENGIAEVEAEKKDEPIYTISGVRVKEMTRPGIYIVGRKKVIKR
ncbi:MAG: hypothetical protein J6R36_01560 [Bacteroidaceae bacterium]|nr:hypothetical protein [Bacteroidaceae bacterium]